MHKRPCTETPDIDGDDGACLSSYLCKTTVVHHQSIYGRWLKVTFARQYITLCVCHQNNYPRKSSYNVPVFQVCDVEVPLTISYSALWLVLTG